MVVDATLCEECRFAALERMLVLREYLVRTMDDPTCELPYQHRPLS